MDIFLDLANRKHIITLKLHPLSPPRDPVASELQFEEPDQGGQRGEDGKGQLADQGGWTALGFQPAAS